MAGVGEEHRKRIALAVLLVGVALILLGFALVLLHHQTIQASQAGLRPAPLSTTLAAQRIRIALFLLVLLVGVFSISSIAFLRWSRRFRKRMFHRPSPPTPAADVWAMHRLPETAGGDEPVEPEEPLL